MKENYLTYEQNKNSPEALPMYSMKSHNLYHMNENTHIKIMIMHSTAKQKTNAKLIHKNKTMVYDKQEENQCFIYLTVN
jgi:hypothetical protein